MHSFDLAKWKVMKSLACPWTDERMTVCTEKKYFLFYLFYFIKVYTDFISWGKLNLMTRCHCLSPWLTHEAPLCSKKPKQDYIFTLYSALRAGSVLLV